MFLDSQLQFSDAQALSSSAASTNVIDLVVDGNVGIGEPMTAVLVLDVAADDGDANETYVVDLETDATNSFSGSEVNLGSATITRGDAAGSRYLIPVPASTAGDRFLRLNYTLGGTTPSMTVTAFLQPQNMLQNEVVYPDNITIS
jgi:hypothetical protein